MAVFEIVCNFYYLKKVLLIALIVTIGTNSLSVHAISSEDESCKREDGIKAYKGENASAFSIMGKSDKMEDTFAIEETYIGEPEVSLYGVFDGHGGDRAAKYTAQNLLVMMKTKLKEIRKNIREGNEADYTNNGVINYEKFLKDEIKAFNDGDLQKELEKNNDNSGTTAVIALVTEDKVYVANVGNSRAVLVDINVNAIQITEDHKPNQKTEWKRIMALPNGKIIPTETRSLLQIKDTKDNQEHDMTISRSLGDRLLRDEKYGLIADADTFVEEFSKKKSNFLILASNGLWNVVDNTWVANYFYYEGKEKDVANIAQAKGSVDDITIMVIQPSKVHDSIGESGERSYKSENVNVFSTIGTRTTMEDAFAMIEHIGKPEVSLYGVFDGYFGDRAAKYTATHLLVKMKTKLEEIRKHIEEGKKADYTNNGVINYEEFLKGEIKAFNDGDLQTELKENNDKSGTTALIALITENMLYVANVGSSRAVMADENGKAIQITKDHILHNDEERARIEKLSGDQIQTPNLYVYDGTKVFKTSLTRSLGNTDVGNLANGFIADAETFAREFSKEKSKFIILASNGIWSILENEEVVRYIKDKTAIYSSKQNIAKMITEEAKGEGSTENITVMIIMP